MYIIQTTKGNGTVVGGTYVVYTKKATAEETAAYMQESFKKSEFAADWTVEVIEVKVIDW